MIRKIFLPMIMLVMLTGAALAATFPSPPTHDIYVADYASMISEADKNQMLELGRELDQKHGAQIAVVTFDTLDGADIDEYANGLFRAWGIGDSKKNNGVLLLIAKDDQKFRIEVGYGLEGAITDGYAGSVLDGLKEQFRAENYSSAILNAYTQLTLKVYEEYGDAPPDNLNKPSDSEELTWWETLMGASIIAGFLGAVYGICKFVKNGLFSASDTDGSTASDTDDDDHSSGGSNDGNFGGGSSGGGGASDDW